MPLLHLFAVPQGALHAACGWFLAEAYPVQPGETRCPHVVDDAEGRPCLPHGLLTSRDTLAARTILCYDCVVLAIEAFTPHWHAPPGEGEKK
jgi:hypothetical protein